MITKFINFDGRLKALFIQEFINSTCYFAPLSFIAVFLYNYAHMSKSDIALAMLIGVWASRSTRIFLAHVFDKIRVNILFFGYKYLVDWAIYY